VARLEVQVFKPKLDDRYSRNHLASHSQQKLPSVVVERAFDILDRVQENTKVVGIDEAQFFGPEIVKVVNYLADNGRRVIVAGLDTDWQGHPFAPMPELMSVAEVVKKVYAVCVRCGDSATRTQRLVNSSENILVGATGVYEARCRHCFEAGRKPREVPKAPDPINELPAESELRVTPF
jgi:thymidine kinase